MVHGRRPNGLSVSANQAETVKRILIARGWLDRGMRVVRSGGEVLFPLLPEAVGNAGDLGIFGAETIYHRFQPRTARAVSLRTALEGVLSRDDINLIGRSYDVIGGILLIELSDLLQDRRKEIGEALLRWLPVKTVAVKTGPTSGDRRLREIEVIAGSSSLETTHRENGLELSLDLGRVFFNPRLGSERKRVAELSTEDSLVIDMFSGVGPFSILVARMSRRADAKVFAIDKNQRAVDYLIRNARRNRAWNLTAVCGDSGKETPRIARTVGKADRVIMNLPASADAFLAAAVSSLRTGGCLHYYRLMPKDSARARMEEELAQHAQFGTDGFREVEEYSPSRSVYVVDAIMEGRLEEEQNGHRGKPARNR